MSEKKLHYGIDRYLNLTWTNYAFELFQTNQPEKISYTLLKEYLNQEIAGKESSRKTANQLKRLWITQTDELLPLRKVLLGSSLPIPPEWNTLFHFGMALNVFPVFFETCRVLGQLAIVTSSFSRETVENRMMEVFGNPTTTPRIVARVIQTLEGWGFLLTSGSTITLKEIVLEQKFVAGWVVLALLFTQQNKQIELTRLITMPEMLGVVLVDIRGVIRETDYLQMKRDPQGLEVVFTGDLAV